MEKCPKNYLRGQALEKLMQTPLGEKLQKALEIIDTAEQHYFAMIEKQDELELTGIKAVVILTFAILKKIAEGKKPSAFSVADWSDVATAVSKCAILADDRQYSAFVFCLYERYIRFCVMQLEGVISAFSYDVVSALADELHEKTANLNAGNITETKYIEDCLWISLEAMLKLLASTAVLFGDNRIADFTDALTSFAFEYGRMMLYSRELELVNQYISYQYQLDEELNQKYLDYMEDLEKEADSFRALVDKAFSSDFRDTFLKSALLAKISGVTDEDILSTRENIDFFFLDTEI